MPAPVKNGSRGGNGGGRAAMLRGGRQPAANCESCLMEQAAAVASGSVGSKLPSMPAETDAVQSKSFY